MFTNESFNNRVEDEPSLIESSPGELKSSFIHLQPNFISDRRNHI
jgi:hypothetical protein